MKKTSDHKVKFYECCVKRLFDILFALFTLVLLSPITLLCMVAIKLDDVHGKIFFRQPRNGKNGKVINIVKFRTMKQELCGSDIDPTVDTLTRVGKVIRKLSLDEIPQFISILRGEMSLIGPRPLLLAYYDWFIEEELRRFDVRPGLTGMSQINGRANLSWDERFALDVQYVDNLSFLLDVKIFFSTFFVVFSHKDVIMDGENSLERFDDYRRRALRKSKVIMMKRRSKNSGIVGKTRAYKMRG